MAKTCVFLYPVPPYNATEGASLPDDVANDLGRRGLVSFAGAPAVASTTSLAVESSEAAALIAMTGSTVAQAEDGGQPV